MRERPRRRIGGVAYWTVAIVLTVFGFIDLIGLIGAPLLAVGVAMLAFGAWRHSRHVFVPGIAATLAFFAGFFLVVPWWCETGSGMDPVTTCHHAFGLVPYGVPEGLRPAIVAGSMVAVGVWFLAGRLTRDGSHQVSGSA